MIDVKKVVSVVSLALLLTSGSAYAESSNATANTKEMSQVSGVALLKESYNYLGTLDRYAFKASVTTTDFDAEGNSIVNKRTADVKVKRPDAFRVDSVGENFNRSLYLSSGIFTMIDNNEKYYASVKTGGDIDKTLNYINRKLGIVVPLSTLLHSDMAKFIHPKKVQYFGTKMVNGIECNYIAFKQGKTTVHMWIENSDKPLVQAAKIVTDSNAEKGTTDMVIKWDTNPHFSDSKFVFTAPKDASNISIRPAK